MMIRTFACAALASAATAAHLSGPMDDRMNACFEANCPDFSGFMAAPNFQGTGMPFSAFVSPPMNSNPFIYDMPYAIAVLGLDGVEGATEFTYRNETGGAQTLTATATADYTTMFTCVCTNCGAPVEAIFQPIGRAICSSVGVDLPCQSEFDACKAANADTITSTGTLAGRDLVYPAVGGPGADNMMAASTDPCHPEAAFFGYKVGYNLTEDCNAEGTALASGGGATALALAQCVAASRVSAYQADYNCLLSQGGPSCGTPYSCTCEEGSGPYDNGACYPPAPPPPPPPPAGDAGDAGPTKASGTTTTTVGVSSVLALAVANL